VAAAPITSPRRKTDPDTAKAKSRKGAAIRYGRPEEAAIADRDLREARLAAYISDLVDKAPPLTAEQRVRLTQLLVGAR
jgi:hypothetical protein